MKQKLDNIEKTLIRIDKTLVKQEANLGEHMRRTALLEGELKHLSEEFEPVQDHVKNVKFALKAGAALLGVVATLVALISRI